MILNIVTQKPEQVFADIQRIYAPSNVEHMPINDDIHCFEITPCNNQPEVYSLEGLVTLSEYCDIPIYNIRIY